MSHILSYYRETKKKKKGFWETLDKEGTREEKIATTRGQSKKGENGALKRFSSGRFFNYYREKFLEGDLKILWDFEPVISLILRNLKTKGKKTLSVNVWRQKQHQGLKKESTLGKKKKHKFHHCFRNKEMTKKSRRKNNKGERDERRMNKRRGEEVRKRKFQETHDDSNGEGRGWSKKREIGALQRFSSGQIFLVWSR